MRLLVIRLSAMGDVALAAPVLRSLTSKYPDHEILMVTRKSFAPFFYSIPKVTLFHPDLKGRHSGFAGIFRLYKDIRALGKIDAVADLHDVLRTKILRFLFFIRGVQVRKIDKGRSEKKKLINGVIRKQLVHSAERYRRVFEACGLPPGTWTGRSLLVPETSDIQAAGILGDGDTLNIGVAPYAKHPLKMWPEEYMKTLLSMIASRRKVKFWLFGGIEEKERLEKLATEINNCESVAGRFTLEQELAFIGRLSFMIAMDSSNMHMAALSGIKVVSIWGGTDPMSGFGAWMQPDTFSIRIPYEELTCRPCTVYGKGICKRGDLACMNWLTPEIVFSKITDLNIT